MPLLLLLLPSPLNNKKLHERPKKIRLTKKRTKHRLLSLFSHLRSTFSLFGFYSKANLHIQITSTTTVRCSCLRTLALFSITCCLFFFFSLLSLSSSSSCILRLSFYIFRPKFFVFASDLFFVLYLVVQEAKTDYIE